MLEYLLVRNEDRPILDQSQGRLRWIVIDEAHTYVGSQAAELTLLLRRVLHAFGRRPGEVRFIATSATLGDASETSRRHLAEFLADVAGVSVDRVRVIEGQREVPALPKALIEINQPCLKLDQLRALSPTEALRRSGGRWANASLARPIGPQANRLSELTKEALGCHDAPARRETLEWLDLCTQAVNDKDEPFLPLRGHLFERTVSGLWACANATCAGRSETPLDSPGWPFGAVFLERREHCPHCRYPFSIWCNARNAGPNICPPSKRTNRVRTGYDLRNTTRMKTNSSRNSNPWRATRTRTVPGDQRAGGETATAVDPIRSRHSAELGVGR